MKAIKTWWRTRQTRREDAALGALWRADHELTFSELWRRAGGSVASLWYAVERLQRAGHVERLPSFRQTDGGPSGGDGALPRD